jgi:hypothetical protein
MCMLLCVCVCVFVCVLVELGANLIVHNTSQNIENKY